MPAHSATLIDHVYTNQPDKITECFVPITALTDHYPVCFTRHTSQLQTKKRNHNSIKYRSFTIFENSAFLEDLNTEIEKFKCTKSDSNMNFSTWNALFSSVLNKHAPIKEKRVKRAKKSVWLTEEITSAQKNRNYYHKKQDWENLRNKTKSLIRTAKKAFFENAINENRDNSFLQKHVKDITGQSQANKLPSALPSDQGPINNPQEIIDEMNLHFAKVSDTLIKDKRPFSDRIADVLMEFINSKKSENFTF